MIWGQALLVASDRISAFDVILPTLIPDKGKILTALSVYWFGVMQDIIPHHLITTNVHEFPAACQQHRSQLEGRTMLVKKSLPAPVECIVRGYLVGSGWKDYQQTGTVCGIPLPKGLVEASRLDHPIFPPSTKAPVGAHDVNITFDEMIGQGGKKRRRPCAMQPSRLHPRANWRKEGHHHRRHQAQFGMEGGSIMLIDEVLTPDSSRFWPQMATRRARRRIASTSNSCATI
jgi:phosphoribosylaminoimidazole-succinocarboxamide synthase